MSPAGGDKLLSSRHTPLDAIFAPKSIAVIGATDREGSVGHSVFTNLVGGFRGEVYGINPHRSSLLGYPCYPSLSEVKRAIDLAVVVTPAKTVAGVIQECVESRLGGAIVISAGFKESGSAGIEREAALQKILRTSRLRLIGPNCLGVMNPLTGLNATFAKSIARPGSVGFLSQSGALCTAVLDWSFSQNVGFSFFVSVGSMLDVGWGDLIFYLGDDPHTRSIVIYMETVGDARSFISAAREVALSKPIIVIKAGRTKAAAKAAASHTGSLTGSDDALDAAFQRCGVLRVDTISELFDMAEVLAKQPRPKGRRLAIITNAGGPAVLATDSLMTGGGQLAELSAETMEKLSDILPPHWSHGNPIDVIGDANAERYTRAFELAAHDPAGDGVLVILAPQAMTDPTETALAISEKSTHIKKPVLASWMGDSEIREGERILNSRGVPTYSFPDTAAEVFNQMWRYDANLKSLYETPALPAETAEAAALKEQVGQLIRAAMDQNRTLLTPLESNRILACYDIPVLQTEFAATAEEAVRVAATFGYPVVLKLLSKSITHKTDVGGVHLDLQDQAAVRKAFEQIRSGVPEDQFDGVIVQPMLRWPGYELILGSNVDSQLGPVLLFGWGGNLVEVLKDRALALPPLNSTLACTLMRQTRIYRALQGVRGRPGVNLPALEQLLVRFSQLVVEEKRIREIDINPLLVSSQQMLAVDTRIILHHPSIPDTEIPAAAIRPYPLQYAMPFTLARGESVLVRPIRPEDEPLMIDFHQSLSEQSVYFRYFHAIRLDQRISHEHLTRMCFIDYDREMALVGVVGHGEKERIIAVGRLTKQHFSNEAEFAVVVSDQYQGQGLGRGLLARLIDFSQREKLDAIYGFILPQNYQMQHVSCSLGFKLEFLAEEQLVRAYLRLDDAVQAPCV
ncbi:MAG: bifunctional acetate--CoA ligase family protein/GNAT family N-acetyltransferase [Acidobacteria bacterium]|nr:bifunctional acetate--CoA ligase family protein/GNAT family N-acetyltransferase [Acidobacteriota bacterium]